MPQKTQPKPKLTRSTSLLQQLLRSRAVWLALLAALLLHSAVLLGSAWWHLPWRLPSKQRPSIMVQLLPPPTLPRAPKPPVPDAATAAAPSLPSSPVPPAQTAPSSRKKQARLELTPPVAPAVAPAVAPSTPNPTVVTVIPAELRQLSLMQDMQSPDSVALQYQIISYAMANSATPSPRTIGQASLQWLKQEKAQYQLVWQQSIEGKSKQMQSTGVLGAAGLTPLRYSEAGTGQSEVATHFVQDKQQIIFSNNSPAAVLLPGVQDRISVLMQLGGVLAAQYEAQAISDTIDTPVASISQMRVWRWQVLGLQPALPAVQTTLGKDINAQWLAVRHDPSLDAGDPWEPTITIWYDCKGFLPMRIENRYPNGQVQDVQLTGSDDISSLFTP